MCSITIEYNKIKDNIDIKLHKDNQHYVFCPKNDLKEFWDNLVSIKNAKQIRFISDCYKTFDDNLLEDLGYVFNINNNLYFTFSFDTEEEALYFTLKFS